MRCAVCGKGSAAHEHHATLDERCRLDDKTFKIVSEILDLSLKGCSKDEVDGSGNPIVCRSCTRSAIEKAKERLAEKRMRRLGG